MKGKILFVAGLGLGYVLGTRAGREKYDQLKTAALKVWNDPRVQKQVDAAESFVKDKAPEVAEFVTDGAKTIVDKVSGKTATPAAKKPATRSSSTRSTSSTS
ncbi:YtxH domain-containing protein [Pseudolysinimonas sp.]